MTVSIVIVDDHPVISHGLKRILGKDESFMVVGEASDIRGAVKVIQDTRPDIVILDISLRGSDGISLIAKAKKIHPALGVIMYSTHDSREYVVRSFQSGAMGYVVKNDPINEIREAVNSVVEGRIYLSSSIPDPVLTELVTGGRSGKDAISSLTPREYEVASLLARGMDPDQVAEALFISPKTVRVHRTKVMHKLSCARVHELLLKLRTFFPQ